MDSDSVRRDDIPQRTDVVSLPNHRTHKHTLFGKQEGMRAGCRYNFPLRSGMEALDKSGPKYDLWAEFYKGGISQLEAVLNMLDMILEASQPEK